MSRSYRKHGGIVKQQNTKGMKRCANQYVRRHANELPRKGRAYKKLFESWDICDYKWIWTKQDAINEWYEANSPSSRYRYRWNIASRMTLEEYLKYWEKCTRRK
jgi:hypothetical protein